MTVLVLGAGVVGLTSAVELAREGHDVVVGYRERTPETTSDVAAAVHYPFLAEPRDKVLAWGRTSLPRWGELSGISGTGVRWGDVVEVTDAPVEDPWWRPMVEHVEPAADAVLPPGEPHGHTVRVPLIDMRDAMPWLEARAEQAGVTFRQGELTGWDDLDPEWEAIVNCLGLGAREIVPDETLEPVRGQVAYVEDPGLERALVDQRDEAALAYVVPFGDRVVLGGTAEPGTWETTPEPATIEAIVERCCALEPRLEGCEVIGSAAGLRPYRPEVRLERVEHDRLGPIVHNYGHGGAGVTLAWGCAREVVRLVGEAPTEQAEDADLAPEQAGDDATR